VIKMMFYDMSQQYHAERIKTAAEYRRADTEIGMMAADISRIWQRVTRPARALSRTGRRTRPARPAF
jgi:hypothetical protein